MINLTTLTTGALGFTIALAWNNAVSETIRSFFPATSEKAAARATLIYALVITILVIVVVAVINHTRWLVHRYNCRNGRSSSNGSGSGSSNGGNGGNGGNALPDCEQCAKHCGSSAVIRLWEPGLI